MPILILHGGPGSASDYMQPLAKRLGEHRPAFVYDQLGCGRADHPEDDALWTVDRSVQELDQVREALGLDRCYLLGHSWGGWLSIDYMARGPGGIEKLVLASTSASIPQFMAEARKLIDAMPEPARSTIIELGARGEYDNPDYLAAVDVFYHLHLNRMDPWPEPVRARKDRRHASVPGDEWPDRVRRYRQARALGPNRRSGQDHRAHTDHRWPLRRDHPGLRGHNSRGRARQPRSSSSRTAPISRTSRKASATHRSSKSSCPALRRPQFRS